MGRTAIASNKRKAQLLAIMHAHRERATCVSEFNWKAIAQEAGVTPQYLSMLIGPEYRAAAEHAASACLNCDVKTLRGAQNATWVSSRERSDPDPATADPAGSYFVAKEAVQGVSRGGRLLDFCGSADERKASATAPR